MPREHLPPILFGLALLLLITGCRAAPVPDTALSTSAIERHLDRLSTGQSPLDSLAAARRAEYASARLGAAGVQPVARGSFYVRHGPQAHGPAGASPDPSRSHIVGYISGRNPRYRSELVLVTGDLDRPAAAAILEAARLLVHEASMYIVPEASVGFALWSPPNTGSAGVADFLGRPTWALDGIRSVIHVATDMGGLEDQRALWAQAGIPFLVVLPDEAIAPEITRARTLHVATTYRLAEQSLLLMRSVAAGPAVPVAGAVPTRSNP